MADWYYKVVEDLKYIPDCVAYFNKELVDAREELKMKGKRLEQCSSKLPGIVEHRFNQLQEIEAILEYLNTNLRKLRSEKFKMYTTAYNKDLSSRDAEKYIDGDKEVVDMAYIINEIAFVRNKYLGISKALEQKSWQIGHITRLRCAGLDDAILD